MSIASRYAEALFQLSKEEERLAEVSDSFSALIESISDNDDFFQIVSHPLMDINEKKQLIQELTEQLEPEFQNFMMVVIDNKREKDLFDMYESFSRLVREEQNITLCEIRTATNLDDEDINSLSQTLSELSSGEVEIETTIDKSIIGGIVVKIGDQVFDYSIKGQLNNLREQLQKTTITS
ncbi:ATP synthase F1 subunit delta [Natranaerobius trueperi]|uniref:ATP synthase subunit delta n=1 Tax=Natranaerobius trueperi TaxID=759412 RepID=A0A226C005_9FIRM|nr:ATP synthase F1 subunit delta [Natranaerobius trueperi]OWZ84603.1 hypothetical protein CDO51_02250 [Natranaerobius trueperi]